MVNAARLDEEVAQFFEWVKHFEAEVHMLGGGVRRYVCDHMRVHVRYSWFKASVAGVPSVCLADLVLSEHSQGLAFLERLSRWFARGPHELQAQALYVEQPKGDVLPSWLANNGFSLCAAPGEELHSWYLRRAHEREGAFCQMAALLTSPSTLTPGPCPRLPQTALRASKSHSRGATVGS